MDTIFPKESEMHHFDIIRQAGRIKEREIKIMKRKIYMERDSVCVRERERERERVKREREKTREVERNR